MEDILITIVNSMEKRLIFVDDYHIIKYLNNAAKEHYLSKGYRDIVGKSIFSFHKEKTNEKIKMAVRVLEANNSLPKATIGDTDIFPVRINNKFCGYYEIF